MMPALPRNIEGLTWCVRIATEVDLRTRKEWLEDAGLRLVWVDDRFGLQSALFERFASSGDVQDEAARITRSLNGLHRLQFRSSLDLAPVDVMQFHPDGHCTHHITGHLVINVSAFGDAQVINSKGEVVTRKPARPSAPQVVINDALANRAMRMYGDVREGDWTALYRVYEVIEGDVGDVSKHGWATKALIQRFSRCCHSLTVAGDMARHGKETQQPPVDPISFHEALGLIESLLRHWLEHRVNGATDAP